MRFVAAELDVDVQRVVHLGHRRRVANSTSTTGPMTRAMRPTPPALVGGLVLMLRWQSCSLTHSRHVASASALAPPTISLISWVMPAWRAWLAIRV